MENNTTGADFYEWTFEGGIPAQSKEREPGQVTFTAPGEHKITLRAKNHDVEDSKELIIQVDSAVTVSFDCQILVNDFAPALVSFSNQTHGACSYEWNFEGGTPSTSSFADPGIIRFDGEGVHKISLEASNGSETFLFEQTVILQPTLLCDFLMTPILYADEEMEAPLNVMLKNISRSALFVSWQSDGGIIADRNAEETAVLFTQPGSYTVTLTADNLKEQKSTQQQITVKPNSGIYTFENLHFGISQARNSVGCFFSSAQKCVIKSNEITSTEIGESVDIGFFALNSAFDYCYFFSPDRATASAFAEIPGATSTQVNNRSSNPITQTDFEEIATAADLNAYRFDPDLGSGEGDQGDAFALDPLPHFSFFKTQDGRRGIAMIKEAFPIGAESYVIADIKIEK